MSEKSLEQRIREARSSQEIADLQAEASGRNQRVEGFSVPAAPVANKPWTSPVQPGRVRVYSERDDGYNGHTGHVDLPVEMLTRALEVDPNLKVTAMGSNAEFDQRVAQCRDTAELALLMEQARQGKI